MAAFLAAGIISAGLVQGGIVRFIFFPQVEGDTIQISLAMPVGSSFAVTERTVAEIEAAIGEVRNIVDRDGEGTSGIVSIAAILGSSRLMGTLPGQGGRIRAITLPTSPSNSRHPIFGLIRPATSSP